jgi:lipopolysaccharide export LptBFGC system permease protein LptF
MWRLHRYYLRELLVNASITFTVLFAIVLISLVARGIQRAQGGGLLEAAMITVLWTVDAFPHLLPIAFLIATVLTFARAANDREITAVRSAGISPRVPMTSAILVGLMLSVVGSLSMHYVIPKAHFKKYRVVAEVVRNLFLSMKLGGSDDRISIPGTDVALTYGSREDQGVGTEDVVLRDCWLYMPEKLALEQTGIGTPIFHVDRITIPLPDESSTQLFVVMENVSNPLSVSGDHINVTPSFPLREISEGGRRDERNDDLTSDQLLAEVMRGIHENPVGALYTLHRRTSFSVLPLLLGPIGFCIALAVRDRGRAAALVAALVPLFLFYVGDVLGAKAVRAFDLPEFGWLPAVLLAGLGLPFCWRELVR